MKLKDGYKKLIGTSYNGDISQILLSNGGNLGYDISSTANTLVQRNANGQIESSLATGTAPLKVASTTLVENLNANLLDGKESSDFGELVKNNSFDLNEIRYGFRAGKLLQATNAVTNTSKNRGLLEYGVNGYIAQFNSDQDNNLYYRWCENTYWKPWRTFAFTDSNVESATRLQTARTIWGQSFDGTADVSGTLTLGYNSILGGGDEPILGQSTGGYILLGLGTSRKGFDTYIDGYNIRFRYGTASTEGMRLTSNGNVLIGTTTDSGAKLTVNGSALATSFVTSGGTASQFVKGDGSLDDKAYITATDIVNTATNGIFYIEGTGTTAGTWLGEHASISQYYKGLTIAYKIPIAGASTTTININGLGAKTIRRNDSALTTHLPVNSVVILVYDGTYFRWSDYDANSYAYVRQYLTDTTAAEYPLLFRYDTNAPSSYVTQYTRYDSAITVNPSTNTITAALFNGPAASVSNKLILKVNGGTTEGTNLYTYNGSAAKTLDIKAGNNITLTATAGILTIASSYTNTTYTLSGQLSGNTFVTTLTPSSGTPTTATVPAMTAATSSAAGKAGLVPAPAKGQQAYFLRGDGTWVVPTNTWRNIKVNGTQIAGTGTGTYSVDYLSGDGISVTGVAGTSTTKNNTITITNTGVRSVTIGTGDNANKVAVNTGGTTTYLTIPYATYSTHLIGGAQGSIPYQSAADTTTFLAAPTTNGYVLKYNTTDKKPYWAADSDTKNTAGSTNSTSKLFLIGATSQAANPQTYSNSAVFATNGTLNATNFVSGTGVSDFSAGTVKLDTLNIPTASGGTTFGPGTSGQVLKSNGTTVYWASDSNSDTKVTQTITTTNANYRVLFSATADDTTRTEAARKATNLLFNPSSGLLTAGGFIKSGYDDTYVLLAGGGQKALSELGGVSGNYVLKTGDTMTGTLNFTAIDNNKTISFNNGEYVDQYGNIFLGPSSESWGLIKNDGINRIIAALATGNVGIGTNSPAQLLDVNGNVLVRGQIINNSDPGPDGVGVPGAGVYNYSPDMASSLHNYKSFIGSAYNTQYDSWWNLISVRHRNGHSDGNKYGMYIVSSLNTSDNNLCWNRQNNGTWIGERILLDSANYGGYIHPTGYTMSEHIIDASGLDQNTWYPVTINVNTVNFALIEVVMSLWGWTKPSWSTHASGFYVHKVWYTTGYGWGTTNGPRRLIIHSDSLWCNSDPVRGIGQMTESSNEYFYVRGGGKYIVRVSHGCTPYLHTSTYTVHNQSIGPTTSAPAGIGAFASSYSFYAPAFYANSDINLKTNIQNISDSNNIPELKEFDWKKDGSHSYGLIAQELEEMGYSELVELNGEYKTVNYSAALSLIIGKLQVKIKELEKEIEALKNKN